MTKSTLRVVKKTFIVLKAKQICIIHLTSMHHDLLDSDQFHFMLCWKTIVSIISSKLSNVT